MQEAVAARKAQHEAKTAEIETLRAECTRTAMLVAQVPAAAAEANPISIDVKAEYIEDPDIQSFRGSDK